MTHESSARVWITADLFGHGVVNSQHAPAFTACNVGDWLGGERSGAERREPERSPDASALPPLPQASEPSEHEQSGAPLVDPQWA